MNSKTLFYVLKRIGLAILTIWVVITITFFVMHAVPGGPFVGEKATTPAVQAAMEAKYGLDKPVLEQYFTYLGDIVLRFDFGPSLKQRGRQVIDIIADGMKVSAKLGLIAAFGALVVGIVLGAVAALHLHRPPLIVIDMGTATTISAVDAQGRFAGGAIVPGLRLSMESLSGNTSQLPRVSLDAPAKCIGTNTVACMQSGAIYGSAALLDGMIERMEAELGAPAAVIATGGLAGCVTPFCRREIRYEPDLLLIGLAVLWEKNRSGKKA